MCYDGEHKYLLLAFWQAWQSLSEDVYSPITGLLVSGTAQTGDCLASLPLAVVHAASPVTVYSESVSQSTLHKDRASSPWTSSCPNKRGILHRMGEVTVDGWREGFHTWVARCESFLALCEPDQAEGGSDAPGEDRRGISWLCLHASKSPVSNPVHGDLATIKSAESCESILSNPEGMAQL